ncbi:MAG: DUF2157 domain-containing protein [Victivallaceae bacterium]|nr:DUF2157 domain-containing protein [Victivallaceae bacterium]
MNESKWLAGELPKLRDAGILDDVAVKKLQERYPIENSRRESRYFLWMMSITGTLLIVAGIALFANHNWENFDKFQKLGIAAGPLLFGFALGVVALVGKSRALAECAALANAVGVLLLYKVFFSVYHANATIGDLALPVLAAWAMLVYIFSSASLTVLYSLGLFSLFAGTGNGNLPERLILTAAILPFILAHLSYTDKKCIAMRYATLAVGLFGAVSFADYYPPLYFFTLLVLLIFSGWEIFERKVRHFANPWLLAPFAVFVFLLARAATHNDFYAIARSWNECSESDFQTMRTVYWIATGGLLAILAAVFPRKRWDAKRVLPVLMTLGMIYPLQHDANALWMRIFISVCGVLLGFALVSDGIRRLSMMLFNAGLVILAVIISCHFFNDAIHIYYRAGGLILFGAAFILANAIFAGHIFRKDKVARNQKEKAEKAPGKQQQEIKEQEK